ncbi:hypothetical protein Pcinc_034374 [Petrolisthes cinctipes]|uniref:Uncharacterized protein n=1 Tax=Petrolisthes cinctipes TaxID=88211 RepID=A0AAE1K029_PETCI|nr:hypothetical protein Pcinc_034374 [Petrolisthes cinctipes]
MMNVSDKKSEVRNSMERCRGNVVVSSEDKKNRKNVTKQKRKVANEKETKKTLAMERGKVSDGTEVKKSIAEGRGKKMKRQEAGQRKGKSLHSSGQVTKNEVRNSKKWNTCCDYSEGRTENATITKTSSSLDPHETSNASLPSTTNSVLPSTTTTTSSPAVLPSITIENSNTNAPPKPTTKPTRYPRALHCFLTTPTTALQVYVTLALVSVLVYLNGLTGEYVHDDLSAVVRNPDVQGTRPLWHLFLNDFWGKPMSHPASHKSYRPLTILSFR